MRRFRYTLLIYFVVCTVVGQEDIEQLKKDFYTVQSDDQSIEILFKISDHCLRIDHNSDSAGVYIEKLKDCSSISGDSLFMAEIMLRRAQFNHMNSDFEFAKTNAKNALTVFEKFNEKEKLFE